MATDTSSPEVKSLFTEKEMQVMQVAWLCLKTGPPEVDINRLVKLGNFNTPKTASNTWGVIKKKLLSMPEAQGASFNEKANGAGTESAKPATNGTKKRGSKATAAVDNKEGGPESATKKRKSPAKGAKVEEEAAGQSDSALSAVDEQVLDEAPAKKKRKSPTKKAKTEEVKSIAGNVEDISKKEAEVVDETNKGAETVGETNNTKIEADAAGV